MARITWQNITGDSGKGAVAAASILESAQKSLDKSFTGLKGVLDTIQEDRATKNTDLLTERLQAFKSSTDLTDAMQSGELDNFIQSIGDFGKTNPYEAVTSRLTGLREFEKGVFDNEQAELTRQNQDWMDEFAVKYLAGDEKEIQAHMATRPERLSKEHFDILTGFAKNLNERNLGRISEQQAEERLRSTRLANIASEGAIHRSEIDMQDRDLFTEAYKILKSTGSMEMAQDYVANNAGPGSNSANVLNALHTSSENDIRLENLAESTKLDVLKYKDGITQFNRNQRAETLSRSINAWFGNMNDDLLKGKLKPSDINKYVTDMEQSLIQDTGISIEQARSIIAENIPTLTKSLKQYGFSQLFGELETEYQDAIEENARTHNSLLRFAEVKKNNPEITLASYFRNVIEDKYKDRKDLSFDSAHYSNNMKKLGEILAEGHVVVDGQEIPLSPEMIETALLKSSKWSYKAWFSTTISSGNIKKALQEVAKQGKYVDERDEYLFYSTGGRTRKKIQKLVDHAAGNNTDTSIKVPSSTTKKVSDASDKITRKDDKSNRSVKENNARSIVNILGAWSPLFRLLQD